MEIMENGEMIDSDAKNRCSIKLGRFFYHLKQTFCPPRDITSIKIGKKRMQKQKQTDAEAETKKSMEDPSDQKEPRREKKGNTTGS